MINRNIIYKDNQDTIALAKNPKYHARTKYIDIQYHFIQKYIEKDKITLKYCETIKMIINIFIKFLSKYRHQKLVERMRLCRFSETLHHHQSETQTSEIRKVRVLNYSETSDNEIMNNNNEQ